FPPLHPRVQHRARRDAARGRIPPFRLLTTCADFAAILRANGPGCPPVPPPSRRSLASTDVKSAASSIGAFPGGTDADDRALAIRIGTNLEPAMTTRRTGKAVRSKTRMKTRSSARRPGRATGRQRTGGVRKWSQRVTRESDALDLERG